MTIYLKEIQKTLEVAAGEIRLKRDIDCASCFEMNRQNPLRFYSPFSLSINKEGLIFIADYNYIWMLNNTEEPRPILKLK